MQKSLLQKISFIYLLLPTLFFFHGWLNWVFEILTVISVIFILYKIFKNNNEKEYIDIGYEQLILIIIVCAFWCYCAGIGGFFWQTMPDWPWRNAMLRDITNYTWPVSYSGDINLVYYFGFYLVPAGLSKITQFIIPYFADKSMLLTNIYFYIWSVIGLTLCSLNIFTLVKTDKNKIWILLVIFIFFEGLDLFIGNRPHDTWHHPFSYLSNTLQLFFSAHIAIPVWLTTSLLLQKLKTIDYYGIFVILFLFYCPQTIYCGIIIMLYYAIEKFIVSIKDKTFKEFLLKLFDIKNILSVCIIVPILYFFYSSNFTASHNTFYLHKFSKFAFQCIFWGSGVFFLVTSPKFYKNSLFYLIFVVLMIFPFIAFKTNYDFVMRATIPAMFTLMLFVMQFLLNECGKVQRYIVILLLLIGSINPLQDFIDAYYGWNNNPDKLIKDYIYTFEGKFVENVNTGQFADYRNYASINASKYPFWKYLAKKRTSK